MTDVSVGVPPPYTNQPMESKCVIDVCGVFVKPYTLTVNAHMRKSQKSE